MPYILYQFSLHGKLDPKERARGCGQAMGVRRSRTAAGSDGGAGQDWKAGRTGYCLLPTSLYVEVVE
jgi:hypothetical protein